MGNSSSSSGRNHQDEAVDFGSLSPQWFTGPRDWNQAVVSQLICQRKLAPFYRPLEEFDSSWDDDQILAARKEPVDATGEAGAVEAGTRIEAASANPPRPGHSRRPNSIKEPVKPEAAIYRNAVECPICFLVRLCLYYARPASRNLRHLRAVLSTQYQSFSLLRSSYLHGVLRPDQAKRTNYYASSVGTGGVPVLRPGQLRGRVYCPSVASRYRERRIGQ